MDTAALFSLKGEVAVVTGAGRGIGEGIARVLADAGAAVVLAARRTQEIEQVAKSITEDGGQALAITTDVTDGAALMDVNGVVYEVLVPAYLLVRLHGVMESPSRELAVPPVAQ